MNKVHMIEHSLLQDRLSKLRQKNTDVREFRLLIQQISLILAVEATRHCPVEDISVETPLEVTRAQQLSRGTVLVPILRAGLGMLDAFLNLLPDARVGYVGMARNETTLEPAAYYESLPSPLQNDDIFVLDPMLATGGSADYCLSLIKQHGGKNITLVTIVAAPQGVEQIQKKHPDVTIFSASLDRELNGHGYILPGLGDAGDRLNGTG